MSQIIIENSIFPNGPDAIDPLIFFSDADLNNYELLNQYYVLLNDHDYVGASEYIQSLETTQSGNRVSSVPYYGAWVLNYYENMLFAIEDNMDQYVSPTMKPKLTFHSSTAPTDPEFKTWVYYDRSPGIPT